MDDHTREKLLKIALVGFGAIFSALRYPHIDISWARYGSEPLVLFSGSFRLWPKSAYFTETSRRPKLRPATFSKTET